MSDDGARSLAFDHGEASYLVIARPGIQGADISLSKNGAHWRGFGVVSYDKIAAAEGTAFDPVEERMCQIRDAVLRGDVS